MFAPCEAPPRAPVPQPQPGPEVTRLHIMMRALLLIIVWSYRAAFVLNELDVIVISDFQNCLDMFSDVGPEHGLPMFTALNTIMP